MKHLSQNKFHSNVRLRGSREGRGFGFLHFSQSVKERRD
jgi:hypothetical protein